MTAGSNVPTETARVLVLTGTTASGKTDVSIPLAESLNGEIINADSRQIFRELNIGTAKPASDQLARVPHHFINEKSVRERWTAGDFARAARRRIDEIVARGRVPVVVGGSMMYLKALTDGFYKDQDEEATDYRNLRAEMESVGLPSLYNELLHSDPRLAARTNPADAHRILRGLAVARQRRRLSELQSQPRVPLHLPFRTYFLFGDREETYRRVNQRALEMIQEGLVDEVRSLAREGLTPATCNALLTHGYQEVYPYLEGRISEEQMIEDIQKAVRHYVKRQLTWFRRDARVIWIRREFDEMPAKIALRIIEEWHGSVH